MFFTNSEMLPTNQDKPERQHSLLPNVTTNSKSLAKHDSLLLNAARKIDDKCHKLPEVLIDLCTHLPLLFLSGPYRFIVLFAFYCHTANNLYSAFKVRVPLSNFFRNPALRYHGITREYLTAPFDATEEIAFSQRLFFLGLLPQQEDAVSKGLCSALTTHWAEHEQKSLGSQFVKELNQYKHDKETHLITHELVKKMIAVHSNQTITLPSVEIHIIAKDDDYKEDLESVAKNIVTEALTHPAELVNVIIYCGPRGKTHVIGVMAEDGEHPNIKYFDSNFRKAAFTSATSIEKSLVTLLQYGYGDMFINLENNREKELTEKDLPKVSGIIIDRQSLGYSKLLEEKPEDRLTRALYF